MIDFYSNIIFFVMVINDMKTQILIIPVLIILLTSTFTLAHIDLNNSQELSVTHYFSPPLITDNKNTVSISIPEAPLYDYTPGEPLLPVHRQIIPFPLGTHITQIKGTPGVIYSLPLTKQIQKTPDPAFLTTPPSPSAIPLDSTPLATAPSQWFNCQLGIGRQENKATLFLSLTVYPCQYDSINKELDYIEDIIFSIQYTTPQAPSSLPDDYDLLIISPSQFHTDLHDLVSHKEDHGIKTKLVTTDEIYNSDYFPVMGRDNAEKIKYFIKNALEEWGIDYVLLAGGLTSQFMGDTWHVPVRYSHLVTMGGYGEKSYLTDLYFADIYKSDDKGNPVFDDWDSNGNNIFAEWPRFGTRDTLDLYPDVYVGRLACRNNREIQTVIDKIKTYENNQDPSWFKQLVLAGGDTFNDQTGHDYYEGEISNQNVSEILTSFEAQRIWYTLDNFKQKNIVEAISKGCGFVHLSGHGSPGMWMAKDFTDDTHGKYLLGLDVYHMPQLSNKDKYPIVVIGGCHNSMFNATLLGSLSGCIKSLTGNPTWYWMPIPECFGWWLVKQPQGGAIATLGCTGLGLGTIGDSNQDNIPDALQFLLTWLELRFFKAYAQENITMLGHTWGIAITDYIHTFDCYRDKGDRKTVEEWVLLGDPSLKIGGYPPS
jgi:hypothetical protein